LLTNKAGIPASLYRATWRAGASGGETWNFLPKADPRQPLQFNEAPARTRSGLGLAPLAEKPGTWNLELGT